MATFLFIGCIFFLAGLIQGISGFGSALVALPLLCLVIDIKFAIPLSVLNSLAITAFLAFRMKHHLDRRILAPLCLSALPGAVVGATLLKRIDSETVSMLLGLLLIGYSLYSLLLNPRPRHLHPGWSYFAGFCSGAIGSAFSAGGPPIIIYTALTGRKKNQIKATLTGFFLFNSFLAATAHAVTGLTSGEVLETFLLSCPFVLAGTATGAYLYRFLIHRTYLQTIYVFLVIMGVMMITLKS